MFLTFAGGAFASAVYSGYAHFDSDDFCGWIGETGYVKQPDRYGTPPRDASARCHSERRSGAKSGAELRRRRVRSRGRGLEHRATFRFSNRVLRRAKRPSFGRKGTLRLRDVLNPVKRPNPG